MTNKNVILQQLCFCNIEFHSDPPDKKFDLALWKKKGQLTYWKPAEEGVLQNDKQVELADGISVSSDTFFNAFHLGYWRKLTWLKSLSLNVKFKGKFLLEIFCHTELGESELLACIDLDGDSDTQFEFAFAKEKIQTGLRFSFTLTSRESGSRLLGGAWQTNDPPIHPVRLSIGITTYNRQEFAQRNIQRIFDDPMLRGEDIRIQVVDQSDISKLEHLIGDRCRITRQRNIGGSGGFSRAIYECIHAVEGATPTHVLLMDDDIELEPDSILRAIRMAQYARIPFILGGVLLDLYSPTVAVNMGETFQKDVYGYYDSFYSLKNNLGWIDVSLSNYMNVISIPHPTDYCGWWFCMMPMEAVLKMELPLQFFIKGDDVEYGLRAKAHDYPSYIIAGIGLWHPPPYSKSAAWVRYMDFYNHLILNSLCGYPEFLDLFQIQATWALQELTKHKYQDTLAMVRGMEDFLAGWKFYKNRTFPDYILDLKKEVAAYEANDKGIPVIKKDQSLALRDRLVAVIDRVKQEGKQAQKSMKKNLPATISRQAWEYYFIHGNHSYLPD